MPRDPFEGDPFDPSRLLGAEYELEVDEIPELSKEEIEFTKRELVAFHKIRRILEPRGLQGVAYRCGQCESEHFCSWDILLANLQSIAAGQGMPPHEDAVGADPRRFVPWSFCIGIHDALFEPRIVDGTWPFVSEEEYYGGF